MAIPPEVQAELDAINSTLDQHEIQITDLEAAVQNLQSIASPVTSYTVTREDLSQTTYQKV